MVTLSQYGFVITVCGPIRLIRSDGLDMTPKAAKLKALLLLLATGSGMRRSRALLQDKLWSTADDSRGRGSLRQALSALRKGLGSDADILVFDTEAVGLDPERVRMQLALPADSLETPEFAEGLDVADPEFEDWLRDRRSEFASACEKMRAAKPAARVLSERLAAARPEPARPAVVLLPAMCDDAAIRTQAEMLAADVAARIGQTGQTPVFLDPEVGRQHERLAILVRAMRAGDVARFQVQLSDMDQRKTVWAHDVICPVAASRQQIETLEQLQIRAAAAASTYFGRLNAEGKLDLSHLSFQMFAHFPFRNDAGLQRVEAMFDLDAGDPGTRAVQLAWRARMLLVKSLEGGDLKCSALDEARDLSREAMALASDNAVVTAIAADVALNCPGDAGLACAIAEESAARRPYNPYVQAIHAQALARADRPEDGFAVAKHALRLASGQPNLSWWHATCAATAIKLRRFSEAREHAELAHLLAPTFKPPLRFLGALRFHAGDEAGASEALTSLKALEPDFSLQRMRDQDYPVASMRGTELFSVTTSGLL